MRKLLYIVLALAGVCFGQANEAGVAASDRMVVVGNQSQPVQWEHRATIQQSIVKAGPTGVVWIPANYIGTDCNPLSSCTPGTTLIIDLRGGVFQTFPALPSGGGTGSGSVTAVGSGSLPPLFTVGVNNPTTTPTLSFALSNAAAHAFFGNHTGAVGPPSYGTITTADLPGGGAITMNGVGCALGGTCALTLTGAAFANTGTIHTVLHGNAAGNQSYSAIDLTSEVVGSLDHTHLNGGAGADGTKAWFGDDTWKVPPASAITISGSPTNGMVPQFLGPATIGGAVNGFPGAARSPFSGTTDTILCDTVTVANDRLHSIEYTAATPVAVVLPAPTGGGCASNMTFKVVARTGTVTLTPAGGATISYYGIGAGPHPAAASLPIPGGDSCVISSPDNAGWLATCAHGTGLGKYKFSATGDDYCTALNTYMAAAQTANAPAPTFDATEAGAVATCAAVQPFSNWQVGWSGGEMDWSVPINTDWPWIVPTKFSLKGNIAGDCNGPNASICATATFKSNFPAFLGCSAGCPNSSTVVFATGSNVVISGTNVAGTPTAGGTANFGSTCDSGTSGTVFPGKMCGENLAICIAASTLCQPNEFINLGRVVKVTTGGAGTSSLTLEVNPHSPITIPTAGTGYQWMAFMPVVQYSTLGNNCTGSGNACISNTQEFSNFAIDAGDGTTDLHSGLEVMTPQEGSWILNVTARNARVECFGFWSTGIQDFGPIINLRCGGNSNITGRVTVPMRVWQTGYLRGIYGMSLVTANTEPVDMLYSNTINSGGVEISGGDHDESATVGVQLGDLTAWPWALNGTGVAHARVATISGNASTATLVHVMNVPTTTDVDIELLGCQSGGGGLIAIQDDLTGESIPCGKQRKYHIGVLSGPDCNLGGAAGTTSPADCNIAAMGKIAVPASQTSYQVNTTLVNSTSKIFLQQVTDNSGLPSSPTCDPTATNPKNSARAAGTGFTLSQTSVAAVTCFEYYIIGGNQ